jgi:putative salt-induced outer membrane protein YdiY
MISVLGVGAAIADEIVLANGNHLTGKIVRKETDTLVLNTPYAGDLNIRWADVRRITTDAPISVYFGNDGKLIGMLRSDEDGRVTVISAEGLTGPSIPLDRLRFINPSAEISGEGARLSGHINAGLSSSSGNTEARRYYLDTEAVARTRDDRYTLGGRAAHTEDHGVQTESNGIAYLKYDRFFTKKWYGYANGNFENDKFKDIVLRSTLGLGSGYQFFETVKTNLSLEGGLTYVKTDFLAAEDDNYPAARWALKFDHMLFDTKIQFFHAHEAYVGLEDVQKTFVRSQTGFRVPLYKNLNATAQYNLDWDNNPTDARFKTDKTLLLTLGYSW